MTIAAMPGSDMVLAAIRAQVLNGFSLIVPGWVPVAGRHDQWGFAHDPVLEMSPCLVARLLSSLPV
jgi:hypothetical protein